MAGKKKSMKGGKFHFIPSFDMFRRSPKKNTDMKSSIIPKNTNRHSDPAYFSEPVMKTPTTNIEKNQYLSVIKKMKETYQKNNFSSFPVNELELKVKSFIRFSKQFRKYNDPSLDDVKHILIQKLFEKLGKYNAIFQNYDSYNFSQLLSLLQDFEKLTDLINLLGGSERNNLGSLKIKKKIFIAAMLDKYEKEILSKLQRNSNSQIELLKKEVEDYISKYSQFTVEIGTKRGANNSINSIVHRLSELFEKISKLSTNNTRRIISNQTGLQQNSLKEFQVNNHPNKLKQSLINSQKGYINQEKIREIANQIFELLSHKFDLAIKFLDTIGKNDRRIKKGINNSLVNNAVYENKDLAKNIRILYDLWLEFTNWNSKYLWAFRDNDKLKLQDQASIIEDKMQVYSQKMLEKQKYVNYI